MTDKPETTAKPEIGTNVPGKTETTEKPTIGSHLQDLSDELEALGTDMHPDQRYIAWKLRELRTRLTMLIKATEAA